MAVFLRNEGAVLGVWALDLAPLCGGVWVVWVVCVASLGVGAWGCIVADGLISGCVLCLCPLWCFTACSVFYFFGMGG